MMNVVIIGVSCLEGMAGTKRVRNLIDPLLDKNYISVSNLIYKGDMIEGGGILESQHGIRFKVIGFSTRNIFSILSFYYKGFKFLARVKEKGTQNILYHYDSPDIKNIWFILFSRLIGYKIIFDIVEDHRFVPEYDSVLYKFRNATSVFLIKRIRFFADAVIVISQHLQNRLQSICKGRIPLKLIPISVSFKNFNSVPTAMQPGNLKVFYGGSFAEKDGLEYLLKAFDRVCNKFDNISLILTGVGNDTQQEKVRTMINHCTHADRVVHKGYLSTKEYYHELNSCDIFCMTRNNSQFARAGFPFKLGEFLAVGKAVIATDVGDVSKYLKDGFNALVIPPESVADLEIALTEVISNPDKGRSLGLEGRKTAQQFFDSEKLSSQLYHVFTDVEATKN